MNPGLESTSCFSNVKSIPMLNGSNFSEWKEHLLLVLALMDLDISLREERPDAKNQIEETKHWDRSNRISMLIMRIRIPPKFRGIIPDDVKSAKELLAAVEKCYTGYEMAEIPIVTQGFFKSKKSDECVREYIMEKMSIAARLKKLGIHIPDNVVAQIILDNMPSEYDMLKSISKRLKEDWSTHELIIHCVREEERLKREHDLVAGEVLCNKKRKSYG